MATVDKNFRVKNGLVVEGTTATVNGNSVVTDADTTDILSEGTSNLYFTDERAKDAVTSGVDTDQISEGTSNLYFTDQRVQDVLTSASQTNISITEVEGALVITAENGVDDSTTDDLDEGTTNLYFTESRARSSISGGTGITYTSADGIINVDTDEIATVAYVNATAEGLHVHTSVSVATVENIADLASPPATIDGVTLTEEMRVLVKDQTDLFENGIYVVDAGSLVRADDHDTATEVRSGDFVFVTSGDTQSSTGFVQVNDVSTLETDPIEWAQFIGSGTFTAGTGLDLSGNVFSLNATTDLVSEGSTNLYYTDSRVEGVISNSDTDNLSEGTTNLYYTDSRVEGVLANSDTDDISEGTTNLYFTDSRAVSAIEAVVPSFTAVEISLSLQTVGSIDATDLENLYTVLTFDSSEYRSGKFLIKAAAGDHTQISEVLLTLDTSNNIAITEYGIVSTNGNLIDIGASFLEGDVRLEATTVNANTTITVFGTLIV